MKENSSLVNNQSVELLIDYLINRSQQYFRGVASIVVHGSAARDEYTVYSDQEQDILLGNVGLLIITDSPIRDRLAYPSFLHFLRNIDRSDFTKSIAKPLILIKPFEIALIPRTHLIRVRISSDIWVFEMVEANRVVYGENLLPLFNTKFSLDAGIKMTISRLFGLNLCLPLIIKADFGNKLETLVINYESAKGILGAFETLLILLGEYLPSYSERANLASRVAKAFAKDLEGSDEAASLFEQASQLKMNPQGLEAISPTEFWFKARRLLANCLKIYRSRGYTVDKYLDKLRSNSPITARIKEFFRFVIQGRFEPRALLLGNVEETATKLMLQCLFSIESEDCKTMSKEASRLLSDCRYANYLHTRGEWREITDHIKMVKPRKAA